MVEWGIWISLVFPSSSIHGDGNGAHRYSHWEISVVLLVSILRHQSIKWHRLKEIKSMDFSRRFVSSQLMKLIRLRMKQEKFWRRILLTRYSFDWLGLISSTSFSISFSSFPSFLRLTSCVDSAGILRGCNRREEGGVERRRRMREGRETGVSNGSEKRKVRESKTEGFRENWVVRRGMRVKRIWEG